MLICFIVCIFCGYTAARKPSIDSINSKDKENTDGSITLQWEIHLSRHASEIVHIWEFKGKFLTRNTDILAANPSKYKVKYQKKNVYTLTILNPVQTDEGIYKCQIDYTWYGAPNSVDKQVDVKVKNYPLCTIRPSTILSNGDTAEFKCEIVAATSPATLNLLLQSYDGSIIHLVNGISSSSLTVTRTLTLQDNNSMFICHMNSTTFTTVYRNCSAGPLIILDKPTTSKSTTGKPTTNQPQKSTTEDSQPPQNSTKTQFLPWTSQPKTSSRKFTTKTYHNDPTSESYPLNTTTAKRNYSNGTARKMFIFIVVGVLFLSPQIIICGVGYQRKTSKNTCTVIPSLKSVKKITDAKDNATSSKPRRYRKQYESQPLTVAGQASIQDIRPNQISLYATIHQTNSEDENLHDIKTTENTELDIYEDIDLPANNDSPKSMSNTKTPDARALATATGENEDVELPSHNQITTSGKYDEVKIPVPSQTTASDEYDDVNLSVHNQTTTASGEYDDVKLLIHIQTTASDEYDDVKLSPCNQTTSSGEYGKVKLPVCDQITTPDENGEFKLPTSNQTTKQDECEDVGQPTCNHLMKPGEHDKVETPSCNQTTTPEEYDDVRQLVCNPTTGPEEYDDVKQLVHNQTTEPEEFDDDDDDDEPIQEELEGFSRDSLNTPRTEVMHLQDTNVKLGQSPIYVSVQPSNSSDENEADNGMQETADIFGNINF